MAEDVGMGNRKRSGEEMRQKLEEYRNSGLTRREFCELHKIPMTALDYWQRTERRNASLLKVEVEEKTVSKPDLGFTLNLANGRRIESGWRFGDADLARLIRVVENA